MEEFDKYYQISIFNPPEFSIDMEILQLLLQNLSEISGSGKSIVIRSRGPFFSMGYDSSCKLIRDSEFVGNIVSLGTAVMQLIKNHNAPVITYASGHAWGAALELGIICDGFISSSECDFAYPDAMFQLPCVFTDPLTMKESLGEKVFSRLISGSRIDATEALAHGIISDIGNLEDAIEKSIRMNNPTFIDAKESSSVDQSRIRNHIKGVRSSDTTKIDLKGLEEYRRSHL